MMLWVALKGDRKTYLPAFSDDLDFDLGLVDTAFGKADYRLAHRINALPAGTPMIRNFPHVSADANLRLTSLQKWIAVKAN